MKEAIELQQEFEGLISELNRLKSINEITSQNSNNAKRTIEEIDSFVKAVSAFKASVEKDYLDKKNNFEKFENYLETSLNSLENNIDKQAKRFEELGNTYSDESLKSLEKIDKSFGEIVDKSTQITYQKLIEEGNNLRNSIQEQSENNILLLKEQFLLMNNAVEANGEKIGNFTDLTSQKVTEQENNLKKIIQELRQNLNEQLQLVNVAVELNGAKIENATELTSQKLIEQQNNLSESTQAILNELSQIKEESINNNQLLLEQQKLMNISAEMNQKNSKKITNLLIVLLVIASLILVKSLIN